MSARAEELLAEFNRIIRLCENFHSCHGTENSAATLRNVQSITDGFMKLYQADQEAGQVLEAGRYAQLGAEIHRIRCTL